MSQKPRWPWITLVVLQVIQLLTLLPWLAFAGLAVMAFDAPESGKMWQPWILVLSIWSYPIWLGLSAVGSWLLYRFRWYVSAVVLGVVFTLPLPAVLVFIFAADLAN